MSVQTGYRLEDRDSIFDKGKDFFPPRHHFQFNPVAKHTTSKISAGLYPLEREADY
jgi:hypothetical protein